MVIGLQFLQGFINDSMRFLTKTNFLLMCKGCKEWCLEFDKNMFYKVIKFIISTKYNTTTKFRITSARWEQVEQEAKVHTRTEAKTAHQYGKKSAHNTKRKMCTPGQKAKSVH